MVGQFGRFIASRGIKAVDPAGSAGSRAGSDQSAARLATSPRGLRAADGRVLMQELKDSGCLDIRRAMETVASHLGVSRAAVYTYAK